MNFPRSSGILLHPTSLPGPTASASWAPKRTPSPISCTNPDSVSGRSCRSGRPAMATRRINASRRLPAIRMLISIDRLVERGYLDCRRSDPTSRDSRADNVDFGAVIALEAAAAAEGATEASRTRLADDRAEFEAFCQRHASWLDEFALFMAAQETRTIW